MFTVVLRSSECSVPHTSSVVPGEPANSARWVGIHGSWESSILQLSLFGSVACPRTPFLRTELKISYRATRSRAGHLIWCNHLSIGPRRERNHHEIGLLVKTLQVSFQLLLPMPLPLPMALLLLPLQLAVMSMYLGEVMVLLVSLLKLKSVRNHHVVVRKTRFLYRGAWHIVV